MLYITSVKSILNLNHFLNLTSKYSHIHGENYVFAAKQDGIDSNGYTWYDSTSYVYRAFFCTKKIPIIKMNKYNCYDCQTFVKLVTDSFNPFNMKEQMRSFCINQACGLSWLPQNYKESICTHTALLYEIFLNYLKQEFINTLDVCVIFGQCTNQDILIIESDISQQKQNPNNDKCTICKYILHKIQISALNSINDGIDENYPSLSYIISGICALLNLQCQEFAAIDVIKKLASLQLDDNNINNACNWLNQCQ